MRGAPPQREQMIAGCCSGRLVMGDGARAAPRALACSSASPWSHQPSRWRPGTPAWTMLSGPLGCRSRAVWASQRLTTHAPPPPPPESPTTRCLGGLSRPSGQAMVGSASCPERGLDCRSCFRKQLGLPPNCRGGNRKAATGLSFAKEKAGVGSSSQLSFQRRRKTIRSFCLSAAFPG